MNLTDAQYMAQELIARHLPGYDVMFRWGCKGSSTAYGEAAIVNGLWHEIRLSPEHTVNRTRENVRNTILHEICHVLAGVGTGHGEVFQGWASLLDVQKTTDSAALVVAMASKKR